MGELERTSDEEKCHWKWAFNLQQWNNDEDNNEWRCHISIKCVDFNCQNLFLSRCGTFDEEFNDIFKDLMHPSKCSLVYVNNILSYAVNANAASRNSHAFLYKKSDYLFRCLSSQTQKPFPVKS